MSKKLLFLLLTFSFFRHNLSFSFEPPKKTQTRIAPELEKLKVFKESIKELETDLPNLIEEGRWVDLVASIENLLDIIETMPEKLQQDLAQRVKSKFESMKQAYIDATGKTAWSVLAEFKALEQNIYRKLLNPDQISNRYLETIEKITIKQNPRLLFTQLIIWKEALEEYGYDEQKKQSIISEFKKLESQIQQALETLEGSSDKVTQEQFERLLVNVQTRIQQLENYEAKSLQEFLQALSQEDRTTLNLMFLDFSGKIPLDQLAMLIEYVNFKQGLIESLKQEAKGADEIFLKQKSLAQDVQLFYRVIDALNIADSVKEEAKTYLEITTPKIAKDWFWREYIQEPEDITGKQPELSNVLRLAVQQAIWDGISWSMPRAFELAKKSFEAIGGLAAPIITPAAGFVWGNWGEPLILKKLSSYYYSLPIKQRVEARSLILRYNEFLKKTPKEQQEVISKVISAVRNLKKATKERLQGAQSTIINLDEQVQSLLMLAQLAKKTHIYRLFNVPNEKIDKTIDSFKQVNKIVEERVGSVDIEEIAKNLKDIDTKEFSEAVTSIFEKFLSSSERIKPSIEKFATMLEKDAEIAKQQSKVEDAFKVIDKLSAEDEQPQNTQLEDKKVEPKTTAQQITQYKTLLGAALTGALGKGRYLAQKAYSSLKKVPYIDEAKFIKQLGTITKLSIDKPRSGNIKKYLTDLNETQQGLPSFVQDNPEFQQNLIKLTKIISDRYENFTNPTALKRLNAESEDLKKLFFDICLLTFATDNE